MGDPGPKIMRQGHRELGKNASDAAELPGAIFFRYPETVIMGPRPLPSSMTQSQSLVTPGREV